MCVQGAQSQAGMSVIAAVGMWQLRSYVVEPLGLAQLNMNEHLVLGLHHKQESGKALG